KQMRRDTYSAQAIKLAEDKRKNDNACKKVLASKEILSYILHEVVPEYASCRKEEIAEQYIEPNEIHGDVPIAPGLTNKKEYVEGMQQEDGEFGESTIFFDVKFKVLLPEGRRSKTQIGLYLDVEAQNQYRPGYPLEKRGIYYLSRLTSSQLQTVAYDTDYSSLQKSYSIWICMGNDIPQREKQSISRYTFAKEDVYGWAKDKREDYDLMSLIMIRLGDAPTEEKTLGMLQTLFLGDMDPKERIRRLEEEYQLKMSEEMEQEVVNMCTYSQAIEDRALKRGEELGKAQGIELGIAIYKMLLETKSVIRASANLGLPEKEVRNIAEKFQIELAE
ncbi:MAG: hypothetical protein Q4F76_08385, partial [Lachnospiraceae bacterium]|nr:hypothetical protein [Lachnospiraceae bacterium]